MFTENDENEGNFKASSLRRRFFEYLFLFGVESHWNLNAGVSEGNQRQFDAFSHFLRTFLTYNSELFTLDLLTIFSV